MNVPWDRLSEPRYAELVSMLLQRLFPDAEVMDGSGGDGGRDVQVRRPGYLGIYELKCFTGRLSARSPNRRAQVERSLARAAQLEPDEWYLVVPINHNPSELAWFDGLRSRYPFVRLWRGLTWLNEQLADKHDLVRAALNDVGDELLAAIAEHRAECDMLAGGVPDLLARTEVLQRRADEISPHYRVEAVQTNGRSEIRVFAKHPRAAEVAPITVSGAFTFPNTTAGEQARQQVQDAFAVGGNIDLDGQFVGPFTVEAPAELGLSGTIQPARLVLTQHPEILNPPLPATLAILNAAGLPIQAVHVAFTERLGGTLGATLRGSDPSDLIELRLQGRSDQRRASLTISTGTPGPRTPGPLLPILRLLTAVQPPNVLRLQFRGNAEQTLMLPVNASLLDEQTRAGLKLIEDLAVIQERTRTVFPVPDTLTQADLTTISRARQLLDGEHVVFGARSVDATLVEEGQRLPRDLVTGEFQFAVAEDQTPMTIGDHEIDLGPSVTYIPIARFANPAEVLDRPVPAEGLTVQIQPVDGKVRQALGDLRDVPT